MQRSEAVLQWFARANVTQAMLQAKQGAPQPDAVRPVSNVPVLSPLAPKPRLLLELQLR